MPPAARRRMFNNTTEWAKRRSMYKQASDIAARGTPSWEVGRALAAKAAIHNKPPWYLHAPRSTEITCRSSRVGLLQCFTC